jgi:hypothetical protein
LLFSAAMEFERALATEVKRLLATADVASRAIAERRPWWVALLACFRTVVL